MTLRRLSKLKPEEADMDFKYTEIMDFMKHEIGKGTS